MKKVLMAAALVVAATGAQAAVWVEAAGNVFYDQSSLKFTRLKGDVLQIDTWMRTEIEADYPGDTSRIVTRMQFKCAEDRYYRTTAMHFYNDYGRRVGQETSPTKWAMAIPDSKIDYVAKSLCRQAYNKLMRNKQS